MPIYPVAYVFRDSLRTREVTDHDNLYIPKPGPFGRLLWCLLDDSINIEGIHCYNKDVEYCVYGKRSQIVEWLPKSSFKEFMRSFYWGCLRNNCVNLSRILSPGTMVRQVVVLGYDDPSLDESFYAMRIYRNRVRRPYLQFFIGSLRFKIGWLTNGRFEMGVRKYDQEHS